MRKPKSKEEKKLLKKYSYRKGEIYVTWPKRDPVGPGMALGYCSASRRAPNGRFEIRSPLRPGSLVMHIKRAKHGMLRVLHGEHILQIHENFVWGTKDEFEAAWKKTCKQLKETEK